MSRTNFKAKLFGYLFIAFLTLKTIWLQSYNKVSKNLSKSGAKSPQFTVLRTIVQWYCDEKSILKFKLDIKRKKSLDGSNGHQYWLL
ncbi:hypothetical protein M8J77_003486 [Diaphorina citri]|nr:hypothetical protein M8J77_003486 [Diaphorina citri]